MGQKSNIKRAHERTREYIQIIRGQLANETLTLTSQIGFKTTHFSPAVFKKRDCFLTAKLQPASMKIMSFNRNNPQSRHH